MKRLLAMSLENDDTEALRRTMVKTQIEARGVKDPRVLAAMTKVKRHLFSPAGMEAVAYEDGALPIEKNQTISQPYIVGLMTELARIRPQDKILEIGTGSGYQTAILAELSSSVYSTEIIKELEQQAQERLLRLGYKNIHVKNADGYKGWPEAAPFDAIIVTAAAPEVPEELIHQLKAGGRMVIPLGNAVQELYVITKDARGGIKKELIIPVRFVPMVKESHEK
jgi:protein-L-isoaspartate(D-aspartate) O-methyltransferase